MKIELPSSYNALSPEEQNKVIYKMAEYSALQSSFANASIFLSKEQQQQIRDVATLLLYFPNCRPSAIKVLNSSVIKGNAAKRILYLLGLMSEKVSSALSVVTSSGERMIVLDQQQSLRRGRPTASESEQRQRERQQKERAAAISHLTGRRIAQPEAAPVDTSRQSDTSRRKQEPDLFSSAVDAAISPSSDSPAFELKSLREWTWMLPVDITSRIKTLRDLRTQHASHSEQAKLLMEQGAKPEAIAEHTQAAANINEQIVRIYDSVDLHLATMYCMLSDVNPSYMNLADHYADRGGIKALISELLPYYTKLTSTDGGDPSPSPSSSLIDRARKLNDAWIAATTRDPERDKRVHTIKAYFGRKDVSASPSRLEKLIAYRKEAETLKVDTDTLASMDLIIADCEKQLTPPQQP